MFLPKRITAVLTCFFILFISGCSQNDVKKVHIADENNRVCMFFEKYFDNGKYSVKFKTWDDTAIEEMNCIMAVDGENYCLQYETSDGNRNFFVLDGKCYSIYDDMKSYTVEDAPESSELQEDFNSKNVFGKPYETCSEIIGLSSYSYNCEKFISDETGIETHYCFDDNNNLKYIITRKDGKSVYLEFLNIDTEVPQAYFKIPDDYEKIEY